MGRTGGEFCEFPGLPLSYRYARMSAIQKMQQAAGPPRGPNGMPTQQQIAEMRVRDSGRRRLRAAG